MFIVYTIDLLKIDLIKKIVDIDLNINYVKEIYKDDYIKIK